MRAVQRFIDGGLSPGKAIIAALKEKGTNVTKVAAQHGVIREELSRCINGRQVPNVAELDVLVAELGGTRKAWLSAWFRWHQERAESELAGAGR